MHRFAPKIFGLSTLALIIAISPLGYSQTTTPASQPGSSEDTPRSQPASVPTSSVAASVVKPEETVAEEEVVETAQFIEEDVNAENIGPLNEEEEGGAEEILVTGSRIPTTVDRRATVLNLGKIELDRTGLTSIADILQQLPISGGALNTKFNSSGNFGFPPDGGGIGAGAALADLRYLGPKRVLVLVDGVRWVNGSSASGISSATDLNTIPPSIIERVEILQDGASSIYGSDAIAGVVNIITKKNVQGVTANAYIGGYTEGDGFTQQYDVGWGQTGEKLSVYMNASYTRQGEVRAADRDISRFPVAGFSECTGGCSSGTPQGRFFLTDPNTGQALDLTINPGVGGIPVYDPNSPGVGDDFNPFDTQDRFNFAPFNLVLTPSERVGLFAQARYEISSDVTFFTRFLYNNRRSRNQAAPEPIFIGPEAGNGNRLDTISIDVTNPFNPFGFTIDAASNPYFIGRRPLEAGPRIFEQNVDTWYVASGLEGSFGIGSVDVYWDATALYTRNRADQIKNGGFNSARLQTALGPLDACLAEPGCVPFNIFGGQGANGQGTITQEMLDYVTFVQKDVSEQQMWDVLLNVAANLVNTEYFSWAIAAGYEHRDQFGFFQPDAVVVAGDSAGVPSSPTRGGFDVNEFYAETVITTNDLPAADLLEVSFAGRVSDYSTFGVEGTLQAGLRWRPIEDLLIRGAYAQGFRAPGIGELFGSNARFDQTLNDPCSDILGMNGNAATAAIRENCIQLGVPADGSYEQFNSQISVTTGGNVDLEPETSNSWTASLAYSPSWLINRVDAIQTLSIEFTYYNIDVEGAIQAINAQVQLDSCVRTLDPVLCAGISRTAQGTINGFANQLTNIGELSTEGLDITLNYSTPNTPAGRFGVNWPSSFLFNFTQRIPSADGFETIERVGREVGDPEQAFPEFKSSLILSWALGSFSAFVTNRYIHSVVEQCRGLEAEFPGTCSDPNPDDDNLSENELPARVYTDVQVTYAPSFLNRQMNFSVGVNNLFNQDPPLCYSCALNGFDGTTYNVPGVFGYVRAGFKM